MFELSAHPLHSVDVILASLDIAIARSPFDLGKDLLHPPERTRPFRGRRAICVIDFSPPANGWNSDGFVPNGSDMSGSEERITEKAPQWGDR